MKDVREKLPQPKNFRSDSNPPPSPCPCGHTINYENNPNLIETTKSDTHFAITLELITPPSPHFAIKRIKSNKLFLVCWWELSNFNAFDVSLGDVKSWYAEGGGGTNSYCWLVQVMLELIYYPRT